MQAFLSLRVLGFNPVLVRWDPATLAVQMQLKKERKKIVDVASSLDFNTRHQVASNNNPE